MTNRTTKSALLMSALALLLCIAMLTGTTFAWFTDEVKSGNNIIKAGNLDIELQYWKDGAWEDVEGMSDILSNELFEPGVVEVAYLRIANAGSLALKYQLGINIISEKAGVNVDGESFKLSDYIQFGVVGITADANDVPDTFETRDDAVDAVKKNSKKISAGYTKAAAMAAEAEQYLAVVVGMPPSVDNEANHDGTHVPQIDLGINIFATQVEAESDSFGTDYDKNAVIVSSNEEAQAALDKAGANTTIYLMPYVDYGTLYLRPVADAENTITDCDYLVYRNEMLRKVENLTIIGAEGATVDAIKVVAGYVENSGSTGYVVDVKNLVIDSVTFTDDFVNAPHSYAAPLFFDLTYTNVDGLTVKNCELIGNNPKMNMVYVYGSGNPSNSTFETAAKNITITGNTVDGIARLCELRQTENVTITNNTISNTALHGILLPVDGGTYSGNIIITDNTANFINERFVRMAGAGNANVVIKNNTINYYLGADEDYIKVTDAVNTPVVENNTITTMDGVEHVGTLADLQAALNGATSDLYIFLDADITGDVTYNKNAGHNVVIDGDGHTFNGKITLLGETDAGSLTIKNIDFVAATGADAAIYCPGTYIQGAHTYNNYVKNVTVDNCTFTDADGDRNCAAIRHDKGGKKFWTIKNCVVDNTMHSLLQASNIEDSLVITGCKVNSKNGVNLNYGLVLDMSDCTFDVEGYAVRFGVNGATTNGNYKIANSSLKSACDGEAIIVFRGAMAAATLTLEDTTLTGTTEISGTANVVR